MEGRILRPGLAPGAGAAQPGRDPALRRLPARGPTRPEDAPLEARSAPGVSPAAGRSAGARSSESPAKLLARPSSGSSPAQRLSAPLVGAVPGLREPGAAAAPRQPAMIRGPGGSPTRSSGSPSSTPAASSSTAPAVMPRDGGCLRKSRAKLAFGSSVCSSNNHERVPSPGGASSGGRSMSPARSLDGRTSANGRHAVADAVALTGKPAPRRSHSAGAPTGRYLQETLQSTPRSRLVPPALRSTASAGTACGGSSGSSPSLRSGVAGPLVGASVARAGASPARPGIGGSRTSTPTPLSARIGRTTTPTPAARGGPVRPGPAPEPLAARPSAGVRVGADRGRAVQGFPSHSPLRRLTAPHGPSSTGLAPSANVASGPPPSPNSSSSVCAGPITPERHGGSPASPNSGGPSASKEAESPERVGSNGRCCPDDASMARGHPVPGRLFTGSESEGCQTPGSGPGEGGVCVSNGTNGNATAARAEPGSVERFCCPDQDGHAEPMNSSLEAEVEVRSPRTHKGTAGCGGTAAASGAAQPPQELNPAALFAFLSPLSPIREVVDSASTPRGPTEGLREAVSTESPRSRGSGAPRNSRPEGRSLWQDIQEAPCSHEASTPLPVQTSKEKYWQIRAKFLSG